MSTQPADSARKSSTKNLNRQISAYSFAAAAAGVSMLALASPAAGEVVITKKTVPIPVSFFGQDVDISLTNDGNNDFRLSLLYNFSSISTKIDGRILILNKLSHGKGVVGSQQFEPYASALMRGTKIGPTANFVSSVVGFPYGANIEESGTASYYHRGSKHLKGKWSGNAKDRYLGVRFLINGQTHYGWIRLRNYSEQNNFGGDCREILGCVSSFGVHSRSRQAITGHARSGCGRHPAVAARRKVSPSVKLSTTTKAIHPRLRLDGLSLGDG